MHPYSDEARSLGLAGAADRGQQLLHLRRVRDPGPVVHSRPPVRMT
jgi:hypothetical protein